VQLITRCEDIQVDLPLCERSIFSLTQDLQWLLGRATNNFLRGVKYLVVVDLAVVDK